MDAMRATPLSGVRDRGLDGLGTASQLAVHLARHQWQTEVSTRAVPGGLSSHQLPSGWTRGGGMGAGLGEKKLLLN